MDALATTGDLTVRGIDTSNLPLADTMLGAVSDAVRDAAGCPISETTSTIRYDGWLGEKYLQLAGQPVTEVTEVTIDGDVVTDWRLTAGGRLWRCAGWGVDAGPADVQVTQKHGLTVIPADIVDLVCQMAAAGIAAANEGYLSHAGIAGEQTPEYSVTYTTGEDAINAAMDLPERTRTWLAARFGGSASVVTTRS
jgi:hypothetical protein